MTKMKFFGKNPVIFAVLGLCIFPFATALPHGPSLAETRFLLTTMICGKRPSLAYCVEFNANRNSDHPSPEANTVTEESFTSLVRDYVMNVEAATLNLQRLQREQNAKISNLEGERQQATDKLQACEVKLLTLMDTHPGLRENGTSPSDDKRRYRPTANVFRPVDCSDYLITGATRSGVYKIYPFQCKCTAPVEVWCDMETDGGGWTVILKRENSTHPVNFTQPWYEYKQGFGNASTEYWIGNDILSTITNTRGYALRLDVERNDLANRWAEWPSILVHNEANKYKLDVPQFNGQSMTSNCLAQQNGKYFSTYDYDNDGNSGNCAKTVNGGFWYHSCGLLFPTRPYDQGQINTQCTYIESGKNVPVIANALQLKIRPKICSDMVKTVYFNSHGCEDHNA